MYQATQEWPFNPARPTYEEMVSAGQGRLIPDPALRSRLAVYYGQLDEFVVPWSERTVYREAVRSALPLGLQVRIHEACEAVVVDETGASIVEEAVGPCVVPMTPAELARGVAAVTSVAELPRLLTRHLSVVDEKLRNFGDRQEQTAVMLTHLGAAP
ncbi:hypothetical protein [Rubrivirga sp. IMCC43871]|uniref:hypothetical protein n=1 Tax=Rubrivirga sp. IMCC43871 TaxID=3391575 RepID=UPI00398FEBCB